MPQKSGTLLFSEGPLGRRELLRVPSVNPATDRRIAALEELLAKLEAVPPNERGPDYLPWKEDFLKERIAELRANRKK